MPAVYGSFRDCLERTNLLFGGVKGTFGMSYMRPVTRVLSDNGKHPAFRVYRNLEYIARIYYSHLADMSNLFSESAASKRITALMERSSALRERYSKTLERLNYAKRMPSIKQVRKHCMAMDRHIVSTADFLGRNPRLHAEYKRHGSTWEKLAIEACAEKALAEKPDLLQQEFIPERALPRRKSPSAE